MGPMVSFRPASMRMENTGNRRRLASVALMTLICMLMSTIPNDVAMMRSETIVAVVKTTNANPTVEVADVVRTVTLIKAKRRLILHFLPS